MTKITSLSTIAGALLACGLSAAPALALSPVTFVSGKGADSGTCALPANPCLTFQFALGQTIPGGEIKALDPAHYGRVTIDKSISITGVEGAGRTLNNASDAITINAGANDRINLSHLILDGVKTAANGIVLNSGGSLTISHCTVRNFTRNGISLFPTTNTAFLIADTVASNNLFGIAAGPRGSGSVKGTLDHVSMNKNETGILVSFGAAVLAADSTAANNPVVGFSIGLGGVLRLAHSAATGNGTGVSNSFGGTAESAGNNFIRGNTTDVSGPLTPAPLK